jgi:hypothetical protein
MLLGSLNKGLRHGGRANDKDGTEEMLTEIWEEILTNGDHFETYN